MEVVEALVRCLASAFAETGSPNSTLAALLTLGNKELITPLMAAVAEGHEVIAKVGGDMNILLTL